MHNIQTNNKQIKNKTNKKPLTQADMYALHTDMQGPSPDKRRNIIGNQKETNNNKHIE